MMLLLPPLLVACAPAERWDAMMEACPAGPAGQPVVSETCAVQLGDDLGVEWDRFPAPSFPVRLTGPTLERALVGLWLLGTTEIGPVEDVLADPRVPPSFATELSALAQALDVPEDSDARQLLYEYVVQSIRRVRPIPGFLSPQLAWWNDTLYLPEKSEGFDRFYWTRVLVHEAGHHKATRHHAECPEGEGSGGESDDDSWDSATGMEAWYLARVGERLEDPDEQIALADILGHVLAHLCASTVVVPEGVR